MAYTARLTKQQLRQRRDATRDRSRDNMKGTVQYRVTHAYTNNNCLLCASNIIVSVAIPTQPASTCLLIIEIRGNIASSLYHKMHSVNCQDKSMSNYVCGVKTLACEDLEHNI